MSESTRQKLLQIAQMQFAERGFDGASIAQIADGLGLSKQALLHHFSSKEQLYGEVLVGITAGFEERLAGAALDSGDASSIAAVFTLLGKNAIDHREETILLMRELLDNGKRAGKANHWFLRGFVNELIDRVHAHSAWQSAPKSAAAATTYQLLGAVNYFAVSKDTLSAMLGTSDYAAMERAFVPQLEQLVISAIEQGPNPNA
ncbi:MAG: TetR/AcrR family transcriptional regulator [Granulosicoccaceae bacterium]